MQSKENIFFSTSRQKIFAFITDNAEEEFTEKEIARGASIKKSAVNLALRELVREKLLDRRKIGRSSLFKANLKNLLVREIKILRNKINLFSLIERLKPVSDKIVLFGSGAFGLNGKKSDLDLFVIAGNSSIVRKIANASSLAEKIQLISKTPGEMLKINKKKPLLFSEIEKGQVLWEKHE